MTWFTRFTRFGDVHMVYSQEAVNSCGIACVRMVIFKVNKIKLGATVFKTERSLDQSYGKVIKAPYDGTAYSDATKLPLVLRQFTGNAWKAEYLGPAGVSKMLIDQVGVNPLPTSAAGQVMSIVCSPVIVLVGWSTSAGAHFVVIDTIHRLDGQYYASVCDPWDGDVHVTPFAPNTPFFYAPRLSPFSWSFGKPEHSYAGPPSSGAGNGWVVHKQ